MWLHSYLEATSTVKLSLTIYQSISQVMGNQLQRQRKVTAHGFIIASSQVKLANWIFKTYPETSANVKLQDDVLRTRCINLLFNIIKRLYHKRLSDLTDDELSKASQELSDVTQAGFSVEWLASKLEKLSLEKKTSEDRIRELEEEVEKLKLSMSEEKAKLKKQPSWITKSEIPISL
ncbi:MATH domain and coiled-coil domain-containing protein At2g42470-like [Raphanus sativus]|uniref:MATH domain and coiled-coil domain-containing protein At2g42470-like n=1 Tax=Raphanus sativus TaxID=3726 RepID=A0A6J0MSB4_RAPSA|nr:MATH domain and coiled-coil domain-containing protein At2g42470-like [Raphanus sativus]